MDIHKALGILCKMEGVTHLRQLVCIFEENFISLSGTGQLSNYCFKHNQERGKVSVLMLNNPL